MKVTGIIAEYNPFHNGHAHQLQTIKEQLKSDYIIVVMSGDFVQRGEPAIIDKYTRAEMALSAGADLVLELPILFSTASASYFADGGCGILDGLGCVDNICFGCETGTREDFQKAASFLLQEPEDYRALLGSYLKAGYTFPAARKEALNIVLPGYEDFFASPNNILGIEYTKSLLKQKSSIMIEPIIRAGEPYHCETLSPLCSATAIRKALKESDNMCLVQDAVPAITYPLLQEAFLQNNILSMNSFSSILGYRLITLNSPGDLQDIFDINSFLANRIFQKRFEYQNPDQFAELLKTKNETLMHIKRSLIHILLNLKQPDATEYYPAYTRILGMKKDASLLLKFIKETGRIPVITKLADAEKYLWEFYKEAPDQHSLAMKQVLQSMNASCFYQMQLAVQNNRPFIHEKTRKVPVI